MFHSKNLGLHTVKKIIILIQGHLFILLNFALNAADTLTLEQALSIGIKNNFDITIARYETLKATNNLYLGTGYLLPQIGLSASANQSWTYDLYNPAMPSNTGVPGLSPQGDSKTTSATGGISAQWTIFDGLRMFRGKKLLSINADLQKEQQILKIENVILQIIRAYCNVVLRQNLLQLAQEQIILSQQRLDREQSRNEIGRAKKREILNAEVLLNNDLSNLEQQKLLLKESTNTLNVLLGRHPNIPILVSSDIILPKKDYTLEEIQRITFEKNHTLKHIALNIQASELNLKIKKADISPFIVASGAYNYSYRRTLYENNNTEQKLKNRIPTFGLSLQWNLLNGFSKEIGIKNASLGVKQSHFEKNKYELQLTALIQQRWDAVQYQYRQVTFEKNAYAVARQNAEISTDLYILGKLTGVAHRESQLALHQAAIRYQNSLAQARINLAELEQLAGILQIK